MTPLMWVALECGVAAGAIVIMYEMVKRSITRRRSPPTPRGPLYSHIHLPREMDKYRDD